MRVLKPTSEIKINLGINNSGRIQRFFTQECRRQMDSFVPYETGNLRNNVKEGLDYVLYKSPYAQYQYFGVSKNGMSLNYKTVGTGSYWDKKMWSVKGTEVARTVQKKIERG